MLSILFIGSATFGPPAEIYADQKLNPKPLIYAGGSFSGVINSDSSIWSWGDNRYGQLGRGDSITTRNQVPMLANKMKVDIVQVSTNVDSTYALSAEGEVLAWGSNSENELGNGTTNDGYTPSPVLINSDQKLTNITFLDGGAGYGIAVRRDGTVWGWGRNSSGQLGLRSVGRAKYSTQVMGPLGVGFLENITSVSAGKKHTVAIDTAGTLWAWGDNSYGALGVATSDSTKSMYPIHLDTMFNQIEAVSAGADFTIALKSDGTVWSWGRNDKGQLGNGTFQNQSVPVQVKGLDEQGFLDQIVAINSGDDYVLALRSDGTVWSWGNNNYGQLGNGTNQQSNIPVQVQFKDESGKNVKIQAVVAGSAHNIAMSTDKQLYTWGQNAKATLGTGDIAGRLTPVKIDWQDSVIEVKPSYDTSYEYDTNGRLLRKTISLKNGSVLFTYQYLYDSNGNLKSIQKIQP